MDVLINYMLYSNGSAIKCDAVFPLGSFNFSKKWDNKSGSIDLGL